MRGLRLVAAVFAALTVGLSTVAHAAITRASGPTDFLFEGLGMVKYDVAYDSVHRVYLMVWGTQLASPAKGVFLNEAGVMIGQPFTISDGNIHTGWAKVHFSTSQGGRFLVSYTKIIASGQHQKAVRFITYSGGAPAIGVEIPLDNWGGGAGSESGIAYSPNGGGRFFVTWWKWVPNPVSYVAVLDVNGQVLGIHPLTNPNDGQSDPEIACDATSNRCLVVGLAWGALNGGSPSTWGRFIDATTGAPLGPDSFYLTSWPRLLEDQSVVFSQAAGSFVVGYIRDAAGVGQVVTPAGNVGTPYLMRVSDASTVALDGGGYGSLGLTYNATTSTILMTALSWNGFPTSQELAASGAPIAGSLDFIPNNGGAGSPAPWDLRSKFQVAASNTITSNFLVVDNHYFKIFRVSRYSTDGSVSNPGGGTPPPPPPPVCTPAVSGGNFVVGAASTAFQIGVNVNAGCAWNAGSNAGWMQISAGASGNGPGTVTVAVASNPTASSRVGTLNVAGHTITVTQVAASVRAAVHDVNGDGLSDLFWHNIATGQLAVWNMSGNAVTATYNINAAPVNNAWRVVGTGDLNRDGFADLVWRNLNDGRVACWYLQSAEVMFTANVMMGGSPATVSDPNWQIRAVGDLNGDGASDLVWQHMTSGDLAAWFMNGNLVMSTASLSVGNVGDLSWHIAAAADVNGDGRADLIWQDTATGRLGVWLMNAQNVIDQRMLSLFVPDLNWRVRGAGDTNGDGRADLIWHNGANGGLGVWYLQGFDVVGQYGLSIPGVSQLSWTVVGPG